MWVVKHLANDWLAGTWFFFWANLIFTVGAFFLLIDATVKGNPKEIFVWLSSASNSLLFMIGSTYFVCGSYPHASQFYYQHDRRNSISGPESSLEEGRKKKRTLEEKRKGKKRVLKTNKVSRKKRDIEADDRNHEYDGTSMSPLHAINSHTPNTAPSQVRIQSYDAPSIISPDAMIPIEKTPAVRVIAPRNKDQRYERVSASSSMDNNSMDKEVRQPALKPNEASTGMAPLYDDIEL